MCSTCHFQFGWWSRWQEINSREMCTCGLLCGLLLSKSTPPFTQAAASAVLLRKNHQISLAHFPACSYCSPRHPRERERENILIKFQAFDIEQILKCQNSKWWTGQNKSVMCVEQEVERLRKTNYHIVLQDIIWDCEGLLMMMVCLMDNERVVQVARDTTTSCFDDSFIPFSLEFCFELVIDTLFENHTKSLISQNRERKLRFW